MAMSAASRSGPDAAGAGPRSPSQPISARGSAELDPGRAVEGDAAGRGGEPPAECHLGEAGHPQREILDIPTVALGSQVAAHPLQHRPGERHRLDADPEAHRDRQALRPHEQFGQGLDGGERTPLRGFRQRENPVEVDLRCRQGRDQLRLGAERQPGVALEPDRALVGAVLEVDLVQHRGRAVDAHVTGDPPGFDDAVRAAAHRTRHLQGAFEARAPALDQNRAVDVDRARMVDRIQVEPHLDAAVVGGPAHRQAKRIVLPVDGEGPLAFDGSEQRAHLPVELQLVEHEARAAGRVGERRAAIRDLEMLDRDRIGGEADGGRGPDQPTRGIEAEGELRALQFQVGRPQHPAHQIAQGELDPKRPRPGLGRVAGTAELDLLQRQCRCGQEPHVDRAGDPYLEPGEASDLGLKLGPVATPIDEQGPHQRRHQRQNDRNASTQQRRLHAVSTPSDLESALELFSKLFPKLLPNSPRAPPDEQAVRTPEHRSNEHDSRRLTTAAARLPYPTAITAAWPWRSGRAARPAQAGIAGV